MVFFKEKSIIMIISMYCLSILLLAGQWAIADILNMQLIGLDGTPIKNNVLSLINTGILNTFQANVTNTNPVTLAVNIITVNAGLLWQVVQLATGTYVFNVLLYLYIPPILVAGITLVYIIFLMITVISYVYRI